MDNDKRIITSFLKSLAVWIGGDIVLGKEICQTSNDDVARAVNCQKLLDLYFRGCDQSTTLGRFEKSARPLDTISWRWIKRLDHH